MDIIERGLPLKIASKAIVMLHGRGGTAQGILEIVNPSWEREFYIVAPQAPSQVWYPKSFISEEEVNEPFLSQSIASIKALIDSINILKSDIVLMGFSQGACLSLEISSRHAEKYRGIVAFTGGLIGRTVKEEKYEGDFKGTKVFISNGDRDPFIPLRRSELSKELMEKLGAEVTLKIYPGREHRVSKDEIEWVEKNILFKL